MRRANWCCRALWKIRIVLSLLLNRTLCRRCSVISGLLNMHRLIRSVERLSGIAGRRICVLLLIQILENAQKRHWRSRVARHL
jgi:hypothetical protein